MTTYKMTIEVTLPRDFGSFQELESKMVTASREGGRKLMEEVLAKYEECQVKKRSVQKKDRREKKIETQLGVIKVNRWRVWDVFKQKLVYPIDEWLGLKSYQKVSPGLKQEIVNQCVHNPYGKATKVVNRYCGVKRQTMSNWKLVQGEAKRLRKKQKKEEKQMADWKKRALPQLKPSGTDFCSILAVDPDATYVRARKKTDKRHELKLAVLYTHKVCLKKGKGRGKPRWGLGNKQIVLAPVDEKASPFFNRVTNKAVKDYGLHSESRVIVHGDGDPWIKQFKNDYCPQALNRLDPYHVFKKIRDMIGVDEIPKDWIKDFYTKPGSLIKKIEALKKELPEDQDREKVDQLLGYLRNNKEGMEPSGVPQAIKKKYQRMYLRGSGGIESNIFPAICQRFKGPRMMWSKEGLRNLSFLREGYLNRSFNFKKVNVSPEHYQKIDYAQELREVAKDLGDN